MKISISQYSFETETEYVTFDLPQEGDSCREYLATKMAKGHRRSASPWQFDGSHGTASEVESAIFAGDYDNAARIAASDQVQV